MNILILSIISIFNHFRNFGFPKAVVFDEVHFGNFISSYIDGKYFFDIHPPFAKLIYVFFGKIIGLLDNADFSKIGNILPDDFIFLRILPIIAGILLPIVIYKICLRLNFSKISALTVGVLISLENSLIVQSRFILLDAFLLIFGFSAILFYLVFTKAKKRWRKILYFILSAVFIAGAVGTKWTGLSFLAIIFLLEILRIRAGFLKDFKKYFLRAFAFLAIITVIYTASFYIHFKLLPNSGPGDAFMVKDFRNLSFLGNFVDANLEMYRANARLDAKHPYSSKWYTWPFMQRPIYFWQNSAGLPEGQTERIYSIGNPFIYGLALLSVVVFLFYLIFVAVFKRALFTGEDKKVLVFLSAGYLLNLLPFIFIGRVMFLYHYETALVFAIMSLAFWMDKIKAKKWKILVAISLIIISAGFYMYFSPLTYGTPLNESQFNGRIWLQTWK